MIGEDDGSVALGDASHRHVEDTMRGLDVMLLQAQDSNKISHTIAHWSVKVLTHPGHLPVEGLR